MCLAVPGKVVAIDDSAEPLTGLIDFGGVQKKACLEYVSDVKVGEYVIVHVGFALQRLDEESALASLKLFEELGLLEEEFGDAWEQAAKEAGDTLATERAAAEPQDSGSEAR
ncbi:MULTISPECIES: HypC/HybG/HupF family hydrogenase formation chaperone [Streptomyces]|uniref:Hydrogenase expression/formation protein HypC n=2 Tax=Streptomyces TaxID=1883 RepID=A0AA89TQ90_STRCU|nr:MULTISPECIES: HypC/HybG/HupF family hydrogenase formation chaperone [Streptomyces]MBB5809035.1 hydrogenase expression/formation protein HypC [Streptomyces collinus]MEC7052013.1 HypC/HybG/HupF family hydrogenase formation chaperone [Streptomyces violaceochromogenes]WMX62420.1 HypC/HybG/HupF family hydrogenase formation chaperone [Streptomyces collinus]GHC91302.1 hydrogenase assembly protein HypC [Streptomyces violaceochromogenes]